MLLLAVGTLLIGVLVAVALYAGGVFNGTSSPRAQASAITKTVTSTSTASPSEGPGATSAPSPGKSATRTFSGQAFTIQYPSSWQVQAAEQKHSWGSDTTIASPSEADTLVRIDVTPNTQAAAPQALAQPVVKQLEREPGYHQIDMSSTTFGGVPALHWEFTVDEANATLQKEDVFFIDRAGDGVAVLTQAPASEYERLRPGFTSLRNSLSMG